MQVASSYNQKATQRRARKAAGQGSAAQGSEGFSASQAAGQVPTSEPFRDPAAPYFPAYNDYDLYTQSPAKIMPESLPRAAPGLTRSACPNLSNISETKKTELLVHLFKNAFSLPKDAMEPMRIETISSRPEGIFDPAPRMQGAKGPQPATKPARANGPPGLGLELESYLNASVATPVLANLAPPPGLERISNVEDFMPMSMGVPQLTAPYLGAPELGASEEKQSSQARAKPQTAQVQSKDSAAAAPTAVVGRPRKTNMVSKFAAFSGDITTLMIRNIPCRYTQQYMMELVDAKGFAEKYDFLYVPSGARPLKSGGSNLGYCFINFIDSQDAVDFTNMFQNHQFEDTTSEKYIAIKPAHLQGLEANVRHFRRTAVKLTSRKPFIRHAQQSCDEKADSCGSSNAPTTPPSSMDSIDYIPSPQTTLEHIAVLDEDGEFEDIFE